ncbi:MAG TPA: GNAT family N-acetyltransferase [Clostridiaceae bacterium]|nr:GNAT family N-acetyltransferase [Clostridiaceae bacterium]
MIYRLPRINDKEIISDYVKEHYENGEKTISASHGLILSEYDEWVEKINRNALIGDEAYGKSLLLLCFDENRLVGFLSIRYELPLELSYVIGDIGYGVRPSERNKGYAKVMLKHALDVCREKGKTKVILGCFKDNIASARTIIKNGGVLLCENDNYEKGRLSQYYVIEL